MRRAPLALWLVLAVSCSHHQVDLTVQAPATWSREPGGFEDARVIRVIDGDTIEVEITARSDGPGAGLVQPGESQDVRLLGIDTPESVKPGTPVECFAHEASAAAAALLENELVRLVKDVEDEDRYGRLLRYVYVGEEMVNARLVVNGYAHGYTYPPNIRHSDLFVALQREAREADRGLWSTDTCNIE